MFWSNPATAQREIVDVDDTMDCFGLDTSVCMIPDALAMTAYPCDDGTEGISVNLFGLGRCLGNLVL